MNLLKNSSTVCSRAEVPRIPTKQVIFHWILGSAAGASCLIDLFSIDTGVQTTARVGFHAPN